MKLFVHVPKCAGTSVRVLLETRFSDRLVLDYQSYFKYPLVDRIKVIDQDKRQARALHPSTLVFGHFFPIRYVSEDATKKEDPLVCILRNPVDRLVSHFKFWKKESFPDHYLWRRMTEKNWSFEQFALSNEMQNFYSQYFYGVPIERFNYIGVFEDLSFSVGRCLEALGLSYGATLSLTHENSSQQDNSFSIPPSLLAEINVHHADDIRLYELALTNYRLPAKR